MGTQLWMLIPLVAIWCYLEGKEFILVRGLIEVELRISRIAL